MSAERVWLERSSPNDPEAATLIGELNEVLDAIYHPEDNHFSLPARDVTGDRGSFLLARLGGRAVGCGAIRMLDDGRAEVKRMYVRPEARGRGVGRAILARLEETARDLGATAMVLEMGAGQSEARALYESVGMAPIPCWGEYLATPLSICLGKTL